MLNIFSIASPKRRPTPPAAYFRLQTENNSLPRRQFTDCERYTVVKFTRFRHDSILVPYWACVFLIDDYYYRTYINMSVFIFTPPAKKRWFFFLYIFFFSKKNLIFMLTNIIYRGTFVYKGMFCFSPFLSEFENYKRVLIIPFYYL